MTPRPQAEDHDQDQDFASQDQDHLFLSSWSLGTKTYSLKTTSSV